MKIALAQTDILIGDLAGTTTRILSLADEAAAAGADLIVFPELTTTGYPPRDLLDRKYFVKEQWAVVQRLAEQLPIATVLGCVEPLMDGYGPYQANALAFINEGKIQETYHKQLLPNYDVFDERRYFHFGDRNGIIEFQGIRIALTICEDIWSDDFSGIKYHLDPVQNLQGECDLVLNCSASPYHVGKIQTRRHVVQNLAKRLNVPVVYVNQVGGQDELLFDGDSCCLGPDGSCYASAPRWQEGIVYAELDKRINNSKAADSIQDLYSGICRGIKDYCTKTHQRGVVLGLSGGIDSALVAVLAVDALGAENVHGLLMPGPYSSQGSIDDALAIAENLGIKHFICPIKQANSAVLDTLSTAFAGHEENVAEENIQARLRGALVMAYANKYGLMALTTGNKSELAVGYCTIYGDMNGGLAPIGDVYKTQVYALSRFANINEERIPWSSIEKPPSAELRPDQVDSDSLPDYEILDALLEGYIEELRDPNELITLAENPEEARRILRLVDINEYKRRQAAPALRVTSKAFGMGRRMPLARFI